MSPSYARAFAELHTRTVADFGDATLKAWFLPERAEPGQGTERTEYRHPVTCVDAPVREQHTGLVGSLHLPTDAITFNLTAAELPFDLETDDIFYHGTAHPLDATLPAENAKPYIILSLTAARFHAHVRVTCAPHGF